MRLPDPHSVRPPAVAGMFYPSGARELERVVRSHLAGARDERSRRPPKALIAPHAGYPYSGPIAGSAFAALQAATRRIVVLGPAHRVALRGLALPRCGRFRTPLGEIPVDRDLAHRIADLPQVVVDDAPHAPEHSLEVELPFLQLLLSEFTLLPLVVGSAGAEEVAEVLDRLWGDEETVIVISSDLSHYHPYDLARRLDAATAEEIRRLGGPLSPERACGALPINGLLTAARRRRMTAVIVDLRNSGDTAGDRRQVVGYGAFHFHAGDGS